VLPGAVLTLIIPTMLVLILFSGQDSLRSFIQRIEPPPPRPAL
jgi:hypothetical protein